MHIGQGNIDNGNEFNSITETDYACGCAIFFYKGVLDKIGMFDELYKAMGNVEGSHVSVMPSKQGTIIPFLKWAGGKRWFVSKHADLLDVKFNRYIEPFLGSGSVFFHLQPQNAISATCAIFTTC